MNIKQYDYDPERLIEEIRKRPGIWDVTDLEYRNKRMRFKLWNEVVNELIQPNNKISKSEMREVEIQLQKKWKSIKDCHHKYVTKQPKTVRPYIYSKQLQFLLKNYNNLTQVNDDDDNSSGSDEALKPKEFWRAKKKLKIGKDEEINSDNDNFAETLNSSVYNQVDEFAFANVDAQTKSDVEDPSKMFLLSLLPHLKAIPEESRLNVKTELMEVLRKAHWSTKRQYKLELP